jgi:hypothetical protein
LFVAAEVLRSTSETNEREKMSKGKKQKRALQLRQFKFADYESTVTAHAAWHALRDSKSDKPGDVPRIQRVFLVLGPTRSGKSTFVQRCLRGCGEYPWEFGEFDPRGWFHSMKSHGYVVWDALSSGLRSPNFQIMLMQKVWSQRKLRTQKTEQLVVNGPIFIISTRHVTDIPRDLLRWVSVIQMERKGS